MKTCLIVDDSRVVRRLARKILEDQGFECQEAEDGRQALDLCVDALPDFVLLDWNMPIMDGLEFLTETRRRDPEHSCKIMMCTTENDMEHISRAMEAGADEYVMKPFDSGIIESKLEFLDLSE